MRRFDRLARARWMPSLPAVCAFVAAFLAAGCAAFRPVEDVSQYYVLDSDAYEAVTGESEAVQASVAIRRVDVARYIETPAIAVREDNHRIRYSVLHRWAEPLDLGIARFLREALANEWFVSDVKGEAAAMYEPGDLQVRVRLLRCEGTVDRTGARGVFRAEWDLIRVRDGAVVANGFTVEDRLPWDGRDYAMLVAGLNGAAVDLSREIAEAIRAHLVAR